MEETEAVDLLNDVFDTIADRLNGNVYFPTEAFRRKDGLTVRVYVINESPDNGNIKLEKRDIVIDDEFFYD